MVRVTPRIPNRPVPALWAPAARRVPAAGILTTASSRPTAHAPLLDEDPQGAVSRMVGLVERLGRDAGIEWPIQMTLGLADGERLYAVRYSSEGITRTLYHSEDMAALRRLLPPEAADALDEFSDESRAVVSEPLGHEIPHMWQEIPEATFAVVEGGRVEEVAFEPRGV